MKRKGLAFHPAEETDLGDHGWPPDRALVSLDPLQRYLAEIRRYPVLSREEEYRLAVRYKEFGSVEAAYKLITSNLRFVVMIARRYEKTFRNLLDLIQEGNIGLMEALRNFDPYRGIRLPSYAVWWIRAYMVRYIMKNWRMVKIGSTGAQRRLFFNLQKEKRRLEAEGFAPRPKLLAERLDVREREVVEMGQCLTNGELSVDMPIGEGRGATLLHFLRDGRPGPEESLADAQYRQVLRERMEQFAAGLKDKELVVFRKRLLADEPLCLREIGERLGISRERVRQIEERIKRRLRAYLDKEFAEGKDSALAAGYG